MLALGAERRREILRRLRCGERSAGEIHQGLGGLTFGAVSQHLAVLERAGLVSVRREGRRRIYRARPEGLAPLRSWLESMWDDALASLRRQAEADEARARVLQRSRTGSHRRGPRERSGRRR